MLGIILLILKIIGIVLLSIIGLLLLIVLAILFVPVRYKAWGEKHDKIKAEGRITWLLHVLRIKVSYEDGKLNTKGKLLFFTILNSEEDAKKEWDDESSEDDDDILFPDEDEIDEAAEIADGTVKKEEAEKTGKDVPEQTEEPSGSKEPAAESTEGTKENKESGTDKTVTSGGAGNSGTEDIESGIKDKKNEKKADKKKLKKEKNKKHEESDEHKQGIVKKVKNLYNIKNDPRAKRFYGVAKKRLKKIIKHIIPRKLKGYVKFGTGDPCSTGKILGGVAMIYPLYGDNISVEPHFEEKYLEFDIYLRGRIRLFTVGLPLLMTYKNKDLKYLRKKIKKALK